MSSRPPVRLILFLNRAFLLQLRRLPSVEKLMKRGYWARITLQASHGIAALAWITLFLAEIGNNSSAGAGHSCNALINCIYYLYY
jgi:hypothetical protein